MWGRKVVFLRFGSSFSWVFRIPGKSKMYLRYENVYTILYIERCCRLNLLSQSVITILLLQITLVISICYNHPAAAD